MASIRNRKEVPSKVAPRGPIDEKADALKRWWNAPPAELGQISEVGRLLYVYLAAIERSQMGLRYLNYVSALLMSGRAPHSFGFCMTAVNSQEAMSLSRNLFRPPSLNCIAQIGDTLKERVWSRVSWLEFVPVKKSDFEIRQRCTESNAWFDAYCDEMDFDNHISQMGYDAGEFGTSFNLTWPSLDGKEVTNTRVMADEMRVHADAALINTPGLGMVSFQDREELIETYAIGDNADAIRSKLLLAPSAFRGFMGPPSDVIAVARGFRFKRPSGKPGRHVISLIDGTTFVDEECDENPFSVLRYNKLARHYFGKGVPENCIAMQCELDRAVSARAEMQRQVSFPHVQSDREAKVDDNEIDAGGIIHYTGKAVRFDVISGTPKDLDDCVNELEKKIFLREGISPATAGGDMPNGLDAGVAIEAFKNIADGRLYSHAKNLERLIEDIGNKTIRCAAKVKPSIRVRDKQVPWSKVAVDLKRARFQAFPLSKLPSSLPAKLQEVERWAKRGSITPAQEARLLALPDMGQGQLPMIDASENATLWQLNKIVNEGQYYPPSSQLDPQQSYADAQAFYLVSLSDELPMDRLILILKYVAACKARVQKSAPASPGPTAPAPGTPPAQPQG